MNNEYIVKLLQQVKMSIPFTGYPLHKTTKQNPFFIVGSGRSGNTLLRRILNEHSELYIPPETYVMGESIELYKRYKKLGWAHLVKLIYATYEFHPEFDTFDVENLAPLYWEVSKYSKNKRSLADIFDAFYQNYRKNHNLSSSRWGDKTPLNTLFINEIFQVFPKAQFIHIVRNPYDVIASYVKAGIYTTYEDATERWIKSIHLACEFGLKNPEYYYEIYYEDLVDNPAFYAKEICNFLKIEFEEEMLETSNKTENLGDVQKLKHHANVLKPISKQNIGKGKSQLSKEELISIDRILNASTSKHVKKILV